MIPATSDEHFITFSCHNRLPYLNTPAARNLFEHALERTRKNYAVEILGYVLMPEHVHILLSELKEKPLASALQALKLSVSKLSIQRPFWLPRYYDFNVITHNKLIEKLDYMHHNPVTRGLVTNPQDWPHSSYRHYYCNEPGTVTITNPTKP